MTVSLEAVRVETHLPPPPPSRATPPVSVTNSPGSTGDICTSADVQTWYWVVSDRIPIELGYIVMQERGHHMLLLDATCVCYTA